MFKINVENDFTATPGARLMSESDFSGEEFRNSLLRPKYEAARSENEKLHICLDGGYGYPTSFLEEAFGGLARIYDKEEILETIEFISNDEPALIEEIKEYINNARAR